jgi:putative transposase
MTSMASGRFAPFSHAGPPRSLAKSSSFPRCYGPQFIAKDFKEFIRLSGMTHVRTSPYYPQSNGKIERWHKSLKAECIRPGTPLSLEDARRLVEGYVEHYNNVRLNSAIGYITPKDMLAGHQQEIQAKRDRKLEAAREQRKNRRQRAA